VVVTVKASFPEMCFFPQRLSCEDLAVEVTNIDMEVDKGSSSLLPDYIQELFVSIYYHLVLFQILLPVHQIICFPQFIMKLAK
jgi:hypothetical protein